jgi:hypothetical protein
MQRLKTNKPFSLLRSNHINSHLNAWLCTMFENYLNEMKIKIRKKMICLLKTE